VSLIFSAEGSSKFTAADVLELSSDSTKGKLVDSVQEAQVTGPGALLVVVVFFVSIWGIGKALENVVLPAVASSSVVAAFDKEITQFDSCVSVDRYASSSTIEGRTTDSSPSISVARAWRRFSGVHVDLLIQNQFPEVIEVALFPSSVASENTWFIDSPWNTPSFNELIEVGASRTLEVSVYLPSDFMVQAFDVEYHLSSQSLGVESGVFKLGLGSTKVSCPAR
jgi:hypothetical protein